MGICPCRRDQSGEPLYDALKIIPNQEQPDGHPEKCPIKAVASFAALYTLQAPLDAGARILRAESVEGHKPCLVRILPKPGDGSLVLARISTLELLLKLDHPSLLKIYEVCQDEANLYIVSEPFEGGELEEYLQTKGYLAEKQAALVLHQVLTALTRCHQAGIIHRALDIQSLVLREPPSEEKIAVKVRGWENFEIMMENGELSFTWFTAPEMAKGECSPKCDIWSCGVIMYILLCGRPPFGSSKPSLSRLKAKSLSFPPSIWSHVRRDAIDLIMMMLDERPEARPSALQCLAHPWIRHFSRMRSLSSRPGRPSSADLRATGTSIRKGVLLFMIIRTTPDSELSRHSAAFNGLDKDGDGLITPDEFLSGLLDSLPKDRANSELSRLSFSPTAKISFSEYLLAAFDVETLISHDKMRTAFDTMEKNGAGNVMLVDLKLSLRVNPSAEAQWKALIADLEAEEHAISFSDFEALIIKALKY